MVLRIFCLLENRSCGPSQQQQQNENDEKYLT